MAFPRFIPIFLMATLLPRLDVAPARAAESPAAAGAPGLPKPFLLDPSKDPRLTPGVNLFLARKYFEACDALAPIVQESPMDSTARGCYAMALSGAGRSKEARRQLSMVLNWMPGLVEGYTIRALCAARMGSVRQAKRDLEISHQLDPADSFKSRAGIEPMVLELLKDLPAEPPPALHQALLKAARDGEALDKLIERAARLLKASNADRKFGDEVYAEARRKLQWALVAEPKNPDRHSALGTFLVEEIDARGDWVEGSHPTFFFRMQDKVHQEADIALAQKCFNNALAIRPNHAAALCGLARIEYTKDLFANAELYLRRALATGTVDRGVLWLMADILKIAATQQAVKGMQLRWTSRWEEKIGNTVYEVASLPSAEDYRQAGIADTKVENFMFQSRDYIHRAIRTFSNDAASHDFVACLAYRVKDYQVARKGWEKAVKLDPEVRMYHYSLSNLYAKMDMIRPYLAETSIGRNLEHTTAATELHWGWRSLNGEMADQAAEFLEAAVKVDPGDPRAIAYLAVLAEARQKPAEALGLYRAALALDEARAREDGCSWLTGDGRWSVDDIGLAIELRSRIARAIEPANPRAAADLYLANASLEPKTGAYAIKEPVESAMLPIYGHGDKKRQSTPQFGGLMRTSRARGAAALVRLKQYQAAAEHFRMLPGYDNRVREAKGKAYDTLFDDVWTSPPITAAAIECFQALGDQRSVDYWKMQASRKPYVSPDQRPLTGPRSLGQPPKAPPKPEGK